ncbi:MAG: hypothetical protein CTY15_06685 [Methylocystis sp.]|nr:MAG: hypothetical protein CTY15_06685 [Methylocystis sp.]
MLPDKNSRRIVDASLLRAIVEQFVSRPSHPVADIRQFEQLALGLIDIVDADKVATATRALCFHPETPLSIFQRLLEKGGACAELAYGFTPAPSRSDLLETARNGAASLARAIATRADLDREIVEALLCRSEREIVRALAGNRAAHLDLAARRALSLAGRDDVILARMLLDRDDLDVDPEPLFLAATRLERMGIILDACRKAVAGDDLDQRAVSADFAQRLESAAVRRDRGALAALLAAALDCRKERAETLLTDTHGEALALALVALGFSPEAATRLFLCADAAIAYDADRVRALAALVRSTPQRAAMRVVVAVTGAGKSERAHPSRHGSRDNVSAPGWRHAPMVAAPESKSERTA